MNRDELFQQFHKNWSAINAAYELYARELGISYSLLQVLCELCSSEGMMTQKALCDVCHLPKTTVNAIISGLVKQEYAELISVPEDKRQKAIRLTEAGSAYSRPIMEHMRGCEIQAFAMLDDETVSAMLNGTEAYGNNFNKLLNHCEGEKEHGEF